MPEYFTNTKKSRVLNHLAHIHDITITEAKGVFRESELGDMIELSKVLEVERYTPSTYQVIKILETVEDQLNKFGIATTINRRDGKTWDAPMLRVDDPNYNICVFYFAKKRVYKIYQNNAVVFETAVPSLITNVILEILG